MPNEDLGVSNMSDVAIDPDSVVLYGNSLVDRVTYVSATFSSLIMSMGKVAGDGREVLVPLVEVKFEGPAAHDESASKTFFSEMMPLENIAFILEDISSDLTTVCRHLSEVSAGPVKPDIKRLSETRRFLAEAKGNLEKCLGDLERIA
ncbi:hypothetical protein CI1B_27610 [Bradyrhizobium ivorense]|uniref:Uncharacterized protein n=1 Tax=Bradyrhizobium ivorense TaxID=2511166 RepID=A0A508T2J0_9BRAD|nr:hypothetical protein [Bradyrhizobium ivorense]VIO69555.1 hypothetical protein CI1B_27610 [Bradyrhizobium ivorense]VIO71301.1 hypothetical protein CI41S_29720 [Bradyrhizobium ivorense]